MTAATVPAASRPPRLTAWVRRLLMCTDAALTVWAVLAVRLALAHSTIYDGFAVHWQYQRYVVLALLLAVSYVALTAASGLYGPRAAARQQQAPALLLANLALLYVVITVVCARYTALTFGRELLARRAVLFSFLLIYVASTLLHYAHAAWLKRGAARAAATGADAATHT
jgi:hypothetical protein